MDNNLLWMIVVAPDGKGAEIRSQNYFQKVGGKLCFRDSSNVCTTKLLSVKKFIVSRILSKRITNKRTYLGIFN